MALTREIIVDKSIEILNQKGIDCLSMRTLAKELDIKAASLYWHFKDKAELYGAISEKLCEKIIITHKETPQELLADIFHQFRNVLLSCRDSTVVFENSAPFTPKRMELIRVVSEGFISLGVETKNLMTVANMFNNYVLSFVADQCRFKMMSPDSFSDFTKELSPQDRWFFSVRDDFDQQFSFGLQLLFTGVVTDA